MWIYLKILFWVWVIGDLIWFFGEFIHDVFWRDE